MKGIIKSLTEKGFGFIAAEGLAKDLFFPSNALVGVRYEDLKPGDMVSFETNETLYGLNAENVRGDGATQSLDAFEVITSEPDSVLGADQTAIESIKALTDEVIRCLKRNPADLYQLHPKMFEELIAEIFISEGYSTELVKSWNQADGGIDIIAVRRDLGGFNVRYAIQCKRYAAHRRMTAEPIRALAGVLDRFHAHVGVIATTSYFTKPAKDEVEAHFWKINLRDYESIVTALKKLDLLRRQAR